MKKYFLSLSIAIVAMMLGSPAHATSVLYQDRDRAVAVHDGHNYGPSFAPRGYQGRPHQYRPRGTYRPQPMQPPKVVKVGPPQCGGDGHFDQKLGLCVANQITRVNMPEAHKAYLAGCPGVVETRNIMRDGVLVEQQRCNYRGR